MEQITEQAQQTLNRTWWQKNCRTLIIKSLKPLTGAKLEIRDGKDSVSFGSEDAEINAVMIIRDPQTYVNIIKGGSIAAAEDYISGLWTTPDLTALIRVFAIAETQLDSIENKQSLLSKFKNWFQHKSNKNSLSQSKQNILAHYDLGNELYKRFLDKEMVYSSAIYAHQGQSLEDAQQNKFELICQRLHLTASDQVVEIGTGWGGLAMYIAENYGCHVTTTTISNQQHDYVEQQIKQRGLDDKITLLNKDYRLLEGKYDKLVSIEMIEAVGKEYFEQFFSKCNELLKPGGKSLIQAITIADQRFEHYSNNVDFIQKYIFPGGCLPSVAVMTDQLAKHTQMVPEALFDIGLDYAQTLNDWKERFLHTWHDIQEFGFDERFKKLWLYYLCYCEAAFLERKVSTVHLVARK